MASNTSNQGIGGALTSLFGTSGLAGLIGNLFSSSSTNMNSSTNASSNTQSNTSGTSTTAQNLSPYQQEVEGPMASMILNLLQNPNATVAPFEQQAANNINGQYAGLSDSLAQQFLSTGGGSSGKFGMALASGNLQRTASLANNLSTFQQTAAMLPLEGVSLANNLLGLNMGSTTSASGTGSSSTTGTSSTTGSSSTSGFKI